MAVNKIREIILNGTFYEMGRQYAMELGEVLQDQMELYQKYIVPINLKQAKQYQAMESKFIASMSSKYPIDIRNFMDGMLDGLHAVGIYNVTYDDLFRLDQLYILSKITRKIQEPQAAKAIDQTTHCSVIAMKKEGAVGVGRNFDWTNQIVKPFTDNPVVVHLNGTEEGYTTPATGIGYAGMVSFATLVTQHGYMAINSAVHNMDRAHQALDPSRLYYLAQMVVAATQAKSYDDLQQFAMETPTDYGLSVTLAGPDGQLACVEASPYDVQPGSDHKNRLRTAETLSKNPESLLIATNLYQLPDWKQYLGIDAPADTPSHSNERRENLGLQANARYESIETKMLKKFGEMMEMGLNKGACIGATQYLPGDREDFTTPTVTEYSLVLRFKPLKEEPLKAKVRFAQQQTQDDAAEQTPWKKITFARA